TARRSARYRALRRCRHGGRGPDPGLRRDQDRRRHRRALSHQLRAAAHRRRGAAQSRAERFQVRRLCRSRAVVLMPGEDALAEDATVTAAAPRRPLAARIGRWLGAALLALLVLIAVAIAWLHTGSGREFIVER